MGGGVGGDCERIVFVFLFSFLFFVFLRLCAVNGLGLGPVYFIRGLV